MSVPVSPAGGAHERVLERKRLSAGTYMGAAVGLGAGRVAGRGGNRERPGGGRDVCQPQKARQTDFEVRQQGMGWDDMTVKSDSEPAFYPVAQQMKCQSDKGDRLALPHRPQAHPGAGWCRSSTASLRETAVRAQEVHLDPLVGAGPHRVHTPGGVSAQMSSVFLWTGSTAFRPRRDCCTGSAPATAGRPRK